MLKRAALSIAVLMLASVLHADEPKHPKTAATAASGGLGNPAEDALRALHEAMLQGMNEMHGLNMSGNADRDFATVMIRHCELAIHLSRTQLQHSKDSAVRGRAQSLIAASEKEIASLRQLQKELAKGTVKSTS